MIDDILNRAETILTNARSEWAVRYMQASLALDLLPELIAEIKRLEDALVEERAWRNFFAANARTEALADFGYSLVKDRHFTRAREQLRDEGVVR